MGTLPPQPAPRPDPATNTVLAVSILARLPLSPDTRENEEPLIVLEFERPAVNIGLQKSEL